MSIQIKRVYEDPAPSDGTRFLVERLWPRGMRRDEVPMAAWLKETAPSTDLRRWFSHDPKKWDEFRKRYSAELDAEPEAWKPILEASKHGTTTLLFSSRDTTHNNAVALRDYLDQHAQHHAS